MQDRRIARGYPPRNKMVLYLLPPEGGSSSKTGPCVRIRGKVGRLLCPPRTAGGDAAAGDIQNQASRHLCPTQRALQVSSIVHRWRKNEKRSSAERQLVGSSLQLLLYCLGRAKEAAMRLLLRGCTLQSQVHTCQLSSRSSSALPFLFGKPRDHYRHSTAATTHLLTNLEASLLCDRVELPAPPLLSPNKKKTMLCLQKMRRRGQIGPNKPIGKKKVYLPTTPTMPLSSLDPAECMLFSLFPVSFVFFGSSMFESERATRCSRLRRGPRRGRGQRGSAAQKRTRISQDPVNASWVRLGTQPRGGSKISRAHPCQLPP